MKISVEDRAQDLLDRFSVEAAVQDPCVRLQAQVAPLQRPWEIVHQSNPKDSTKVEDDGLGIF